MEAYFPSSFGGLNEEKQRKMQTRIDFLGREQIELDDNFFKRGWSGT